MKLDALQGQTLSRGVGLIESSGESDSREFRISFSSETPYDRWPGEAPEILDHGADAVDLERINSIGCVLFNHNTDRPIGRVLHARIEDGRGVADIAIDDDSSAENLYQKIKSGTLRAVSVRYRVLRWEEIATGETSQDGRFQGPAIIARRWEPVELSIVTVPADPTVGVGRSAVSEPNNQPNTRGENKEMDNKNMTTLGATTDPATASTLEKSAAPLAVAPMEPTIAPDTTAILEGERKRAAEISAICDRSGLPANDYISRGASVEEVLRAANEKLASAAKPVAVAAVSADEGDKFRDLACDAIMMRAGLKVEKESNEARNMSRIGLRDMLIECGVRSGIAGAHLMGTDELLRQFYNPTSSFPQIMEQTIRKGYVAGYATAPATFDQWTTQGSLSDFKLNTGGYLMGTAGEFLRVPENGEIKHDLPVDTKQPSRKLETYARQFSMSRQAIINDDLGYLASIPARYAQSAKRTINKHVYACLAKNPVIYDGDPLFDVTHSNVIAPGLAPSVSALVDMIKLMMLRKNDAGETLTITPRYLVVPVGLGIYLQMLLSSDTITTTAYASGEMDVRNPLTNYSLRIIEDSELNAQAAAGDAWAWYLIADPASVGTLQVDYLNGQTVPNIRRSETPGQLGYLWDIYLDWGVSVLDWRGFVKNVGDAPPAI